MQKNNSAIKLRDMTAMLSNGDILLNGISFALPKGAKLAVIGANGSGKSTLMRALLGMVPCRYEQYQLFGQDFRNIALKERAKLISYIGQDVHPEAGTTVWEWCELSRFPYQTSKANNDEIIATALEQCDALAFADRKLEDLSGGERQRVYLAGALAQETPIIFLDEVNSALDPKYREEMNQLVLSLAEKTVISITHDMNALEYFSHVLALKAGNVIAFGEKDQVLNREILTTIFEYDFTEIWHDNRARYF